MAKEKQLPMVESCLYPAHGECKFNQLFIINLKIKAMKKVLYLAAMMISLSSVAANPPELNEKVIKAFKQTFTEAENVSWSEMGNSNTYQANFTVSAVTVKAIYDDDGNLLQTMKYYDEKNLPSTILAKLKLSHFS